MIPGNQILIIFRHGFRYKTDTLIKIVSLTAGITGCLLILLFVQHEWRYDTFHTKNIYRVYDHVQSPSQDLKSAITPKPLVHFMEEHLPEVEQVLRIKKEEAIIQLHDQLVKESVVMTDTNFFSFFSFPLQAGDSHKALLSPYNVVLTPAFAEKYFGTQDILGKTLSIRLSEDSVFSEFIVSGLTKPIPTNTTVPFTMLLSSQWQYRNANLSQPGTWRGGTGIAYVALYPQSNPKQIEEKLNQLLREESIEALKYTTYHLQSITEVHQGESMFGEIAPPIDERYLYMASIVSLVLLIIACINFTSLALGRSVNRSKEVGVRKTLGASRLQLIRQFMGESYFLTLGITLFSFGLACSLLPIFNQLLSKPIAISVTDPIVLSLLAGIVLLAGTTAGFYPAWALSKLSPTRVLKGQYIIKSGHRLVGALVGLQFIGTITLLIGSVGMHHQVALMQNKELGFEDAYVVRLEVPFQQSAKLFHQFRSQASTMPAVKHVTASWQLFGNQAAGVGYQRLPYEVEGKEIQAYTLGVGPNFLETTQIKLVEGRSFSDWSDDLPHQLIVNESFVKMMGWHQPLGKRFGHEFIFEESEIVGVVEDFHFLSLHQPIGPLIIHPQHYFTNFYVKIAAQQIPATLDKLEQQWTKVAEDVPFVFHFMDEDIARQYETEQRWAKLITYTSLLVVFIASLGLFGMASLLTQQRTKEIGIRKVMGASVYSLLVLLSLDYIKLILIAFMIAVPIANYVQTEWLQNFAYRINIHWWLFAIPGLLVLLIALFSVMGQVIRAARQNPVESLRYE